MNEWVKKQLLEKGIEVIMLLFFFLLVYFEWLTMRRLILLLGIILIISSYSLMFFFLENLLKKKIKEWEDLEESKKKIIKRRIRIIIVILGNIALLLNPLLFIIIWLDMKKFFVFRRINLKLIRYYKIRKWLLIFIKNLFFKPIYLIYYYWYVLLKRWKSLTLVEILFRRIEGLILSILIFSDIYKRLIFMFGWKLVIIVYILLVIISIYEDYLFENFFKDLRLNFSNIRSLKTENTIIGLILDNLVKYMSEEKEYMFFKFFYIFSIDHHFLRFFEKSYFLSSYFSHLNLNEYLLKEIKNKPSFSIYLMLWNFMWVDYFLDFFNVKYKIENLEEKKKIEKLFEEYKQAFKIRFFLIWEIDEYIGIKTYQYIEFYDEDLYFTLSFSDNFEPWNVNNFKIEENNKKFIDVEENIDFYINFFKEVDGKINKLWEEGEKIKEENEVWDFTYSYESEEFENALKKELDVLIPEWREEFENIWKNKEKNFSFHGDIKLIKKLINEKKEKEKKKF